MPCSDTSITSVSIDFLALRDLSCSRPLLRLVRKSRNPVTLFSLVSALWKRIDFLTGLACLHIFETLLPLDMFG